MQFGFQFSNLLGAVYRKGNLLFSSDGNSVISPVGNKVSLFDLKNNKSEALPVESRYNISRLAISPDGCILIAVDEDGEALLISLITKRLLRKFRFNQQVCDIKFSPDNRHFVATKDNTAMLFKSPSSRTTEFNPFIKERIFKGAYDDTTCVDWTSDSRVIAIGSKDMSTRIYAVNKIENFSIINLGGHTDCIVGCFFEENSLDIYTLSRNGHLCIWHCNTELNELVSVNMKGHFKNLEEDEPEEKAEDEPEEKAEDNDTQAEGQKESKVKYNKFGRHYIGDLARAHGPSSLTACAFHRKTRILVTGFANGSFFLHEMPDVNLIHSLSLGEQVISSIVFNKTGDWIAIGSQGQGQLIVWEWQSESYIMKQQGHFHNMNTLAYSPDGQYIATGGDDSKVKLWSTTSGFCFVTFTEHQAGISAITFSHNGKFFVSSSLDGTVRAYDLLRYRNFRTFTSPKPSQFSCVALDASAEIVCAGAQDIFEIFVWSVQNGRLLEILSGHEGPVCSISFNSQFALLASASWDKTVRLWDVFENKGHRETINTTSDALVVAFRPDGKELAVGTLDANIAFFDIPSSTQTGSIEGRNDLGSGRKDTDLVTSKKILQGKAFTTLCYSADGQYILAAGKSKNVCIYNVEEKLLLKKFEITQNRSLDGLDDFVNRRNMTEFGNLALVEERKDEDSHVAISLPGVKKGDMASRSFKPEVHVSNIAFSPTGRAWAATTTEGLLVYSLDSSYVFDPMDLEMEITPVNIRKALAEKEYSTALMQAFKLNENAILKEILESIPVSNISLISQRLPRKYVVLLLRFLGIHLEGTIHLEFYLLWIRSLLMSHGQHISNSMDMKATLQLLHKNLNEKFKHLRNVCEHNKYSIVYLLALGEQHKKEPMVDKEDEDILHM